MKKLAMLLMLVAVFTFTLTACQQSDNGGSDNQSIEGVWKIEEGKSVDANGQTTSTVQRSLVIFTEGQYSYVLLSVTRSESCRLNIGISPMPSELRDIERLWSTLVHTN